MMRGGGMRTPFYTFPNLYHARLHHACATFPPPYPPPLHLLPPLTHPMCTQHKLGKYICIKVRSGGRGGHPRVTCLPPPGRTPTASQAPGLQAE